ncbi:hypothetical protein HDU97_003190 [Phlyctochytrium planicorne]|nr:hypothetical protein HDU97_003190 [Phlyctochytrium planicorne]
MSSGTPLSPTLALKTSSAQLLTSKPSLMSMESTAESTVEAAVVNTTTIQPCASSQTLGADAGVDAPAQVKEGADVDAVEDVVAAVDEPKSLYLPKPSVLSPIRQKQFDIGYIAVNTIVSGVVSGIVNYYIAYAMYGPEQNTPPHLYTFAGTIPGDIVVTLIIQNIITWLITSISVYMDMRNGRALPWPAPVSLIVRPGTAPNRLQRFFRYFYGPNNQADVLAPNLKGNARGKRVGKLFGRAALFSLITAPIYAIFAIAIVMAIFSPAGKDEIERRSAFWIKGVVGAVFGALHTPVVALPALWSVDPALYADETAGKGEVLGEGAKGPHGWMRV